MSRFAKSSHKSAARMLGYALTLGTEANWAVFSALIFARLTATERAALAYAALNALDDPDAFMTAEAALWGIVPEVAV